MQQMLSGAGSAENFVNYSQESAIEELLERMRAESKLDTFSFLVASWQ